METTKTEIAAKQSSETSSIPSYTLKTYTPTVLKPATDQSDKVRDYVNASIDAQKIAAANEYNANIAALDYQAKKIAPAYKQKREATATTNEIEQRNFRKSAAANGINVGAGSQYALASSNAYQQNINALNLQELKERADVEETRRQISQSYQSKVAQAIADGNVQLAQDLYNEAVRVDNSIVETQQAQASENWKGWQSEYDVNRAAQDDENTEYNRMLEKADTLAQYGDFSGYLALGYTQAQVAAMYKIWYYNTYGTYPGSSGGSGGSGRSGGYSSSGRSSGSGGANTTTTTPKTTTTTTSGGVSFAPSTFASRTPTLQINNPTTALTKAMKKAAQK